MTLSVAGVTLESGATVDVNAAQITLTAGLITLKAGLVTCDGIRRAIR